MCKAGQGTILSRSDPDQSIEQIVVIRDTPVVPVGTPSCIQKAMKKRRPAGPACAVARRKALPPDPAAAAADGLRTSKVQTLDMNWILCSRSKCPPVMGGVLVYKDTSHLTPLFASTLAPFLLQRMDRLPRPV